MHAFRFDCKLFSLIVFTFLSANVYAASFDCAKAGTKIEKMICASPTLNELDSDLASIYKEAVGKDSSIKQDQRDWIKERNQCSNVECLEQSYKERIATLTNFIVRHDRQALSKPESPAQACASSPLASGCPLEFLAIKGSSWTEGRVSNQSCASYINKNDGAALFVFKNTSFTVSIPSHKFQKEFATRYEVQNARENRFKMIQSVTGATVVKYYQYDPQRKMLVETRKADCINCNNAQRIANSQGLENLVPCKH